MKMLSELTWSDDYLSEHAYLVERGVRPMSIVGHVEGDVEFLLRVASRLEIISVHNKVIPFVVKRSDGFADCGFASEQWVVDLYEWLIQSMDVPDVQEHRIRGLLLGYSAEAIRDHDARGCGRRFTLSL